MTHIFSPPFIIMSSSSTSMLPPVIPSVVAALATTTPPTPSPSIFRTQRMYRIMENGTSVATAITMANNTLLQVKPTKRSFASQRDWITDALVNSNGSITITCAETQVPLSYSSLTTDARLSPGFIE